MTVNKLDPAQIIKNVYDAASVSIKTSLIDASLTITATSGDSIIAVPPIEPRAAYDYVELVYTVAGAVVTKTYRAGGVAGTIVGVVTETYADGTRAQLNSIART